jgi:hypothetical protein
MSVSGNVYLLVSHTESQKSSDKPPFCDRDHDRACWIQVLRALVGLVTQRTCSNPSLAMAIHDIGEFMQAHPLGKKIIESFGLKRLLMELMLSKNPDISTEALQTLQYLIAKH